MKRSASSPASSASHRPVESEHHPVGGDRIRVVGSAERVLDRARDGDSGRVRMLDDDRRGQLELAEQPPGRREVVQVVERELLTVQLVDPGEEMPPRALLDVVRGTLVGILPVREVGGLREAGDEAVGERLASQKPGRDRSLVRGGRREGLGRQAPTGVVREPPRRAELVEDFRVALRRADGRDVSEVLRGRAEHRWPPDVDHLDRIRLGDTVARDDLRERVERDADEVDRLDPVVVERGQVFRVIAARQNRRVDPRVERLHSAAEHLRDLGQLLDRRRVDPALREMLGGAAACDEVDSEVLETLRELDQPGLVPGG